MRVPELIDLTNDRHQNEHKGKHCSRSDSNDCQMKFIASSQRLNFGVKILQIEQHYHATYDEQSANHQNGNQRSQHKSGSHRMINIAHETYTYDAITVDFTQCHYGDG